MSIFNDRFNKGDATIFMFDREIYALACILIIILHLQGNVRNRFGWKLTRKVSIPIDSSTHWICKMFDCFYFENCSKREMYYQERPQMPMLIWAVNWNFFELFFFCKNLWNEEGKTSSRKKKYSAYYNLYLPHIISDIKLISYQKYVVGIGITQF